MLMVEKNTIDKQQARRAFNRAAASYDAVAELQNEIGDRLIERLDYIRLQPERILDLGAGTGYFSRALLKRYRKADVVALDIAENMLQRVQSRGGWFRKPRCVCADGESLPFADKAAGLYPLTAGTYSGSGGRYRFFFQRLVKALSQG